MNVIESLLTKQTSALLGAATATQPETHPQPEVTAAAPTVLIAPKQTTTAPLNESRLHGAEFNYGPNTYAAYAAAAAAAATAPGVYGAKQLLLATGNRQHYSRSCGTTTNTTARIPSTSNVTMSPMSSTPLSPFASLKMQLTLASSIDSNTVRSPLTVDRYQQDEDRENIPVHIIYMNNTGGGGTVAAAAVNDERRRETTTAHEVVATTGAADAVGQPLMIVEGQTAAGAADAMALTYMLFEDADDRDDTENYSHFN